MKFLLTFSTLTVILATASAFTAAPVRRTVKSISPTSLYSTVEASPFIQGARIIRDDLPIVYVYDHCPFCVRVRLALGVKNVKHNVVFLQNDDIPTPTKLIGKKIAPIFVSVYNLYVIFLNKTHIILYHFYSFQQFMSTSSPLPIYSLNSPYQKTTLPWENPLILSQK
jgi:glutaredoxin